jgi:hypothetical protein
MLSVVRIVNGSRGWYEAGASVRQRAAGAAVTKGLSAARRRG